MNRKEIANRLTKRIYSESSFSKIELRDIILAELTKILHTDKGRLTEGTLVK